MGKYGKTVFVVDSIDGHMKLKQSQCIFCKEGSLVWSSANEDSVIRSDAVKCENCGKMFPTIFGVPYLGSFSEADVISLIEIAAFSDRFTKKSVAGNLELTNYQGLNYRDWIKVIEEYAISEHPEKVLKEFGEEKEPAWFPNRLREHLSFNAVTQSVDLKSKDVLDIGAGSGFDSLKYFHRGARVTAMEFNPILAAVGLKNFPELCWVGGSSYTLPFQDESFDCVCANAALHHLLNIPRAMEEMLRVLKPGGKIITISDSFTPAGTSEYNEAKIFNAHSDVLMGLNEQAPPFDQFIETILKYRDCLNAVFYTHTVSGLADYSRRWTLDEAIEKLSNRGGYFASIVITKMVGFKTKVWISDSEALSPYVYTNALTDPSSAANMLANFLPRNYLDQELLAAENPKFNLMNGWKLFSSGCGFREFYRRGRFFYTSTKVQNKFLNLVFSTPYHPSSFEFELTIRLNNIDLFKKAFLRGTTNSISVPMGDIDLKRFRNSVLEIRSDFEFSEHQYNLVSVESLSFEDNGMSFGVDLAVNSGLESVVRLVFDNLEVVTVIGDTDSKLVTNVINRLRKMGKRVSLVASESQVEFYSWIPRVQIVGTYDESFGGSGVGSGVRDFEIDAPVALIVSQSQAKAEELLRRLSADLTKVFTIGEGGRLLGQRG